MDFWPQGDFSRVGHDANLPQYLDDRLVVTQSSPKRVKKTSVLPGYQGSQGDFSRVGHDANLPQYLDDRLVVTQSSPKSVKTTSVLPGYQWSIK